MPSSPHHSSWVMLGLLLGFAVIYFLKDRPRDAKWLTDEERGALEAQLAHRLGELEGASAFQHAAQEIFLLNDLDGDGCITREEWLGSDAVFDALDTDKDGRLAPEDIKGGLGAALVGAGTGQP